MEDRFRQYFDDMPCYLSVHDPDFRIVEANRRFAADFGDRVGDLCYAAYKDRSEVCPDCPVEATFRHGEAQVSEQTLLTRSGEEVPVRVRTTPIRNDAGEITHVMEMHTDLRNLRKMERLYEESQVRLAQLFEEVPCFICVQGPDRVIQHANRRFREAFGPAMGGHCFRVLKHREEQCLVCHSQMTFEAGEPHQHEEVLTTVDGEQINVLFRTAPLRNKDGEIEAVMEMGVDISELRQLQSQLTSIGLLVGSISHGIKGLLTGLDGGIYLVNSGLEKDKPERVKQGWEMVERNVDRIRNMVLDILYYAKDRDLEVIDIDATELVADLTEGVRKRASDLNVAVAVEVEPDVGSFPGDAKAVRAMLQNVLENSLDACRANTANHEHAVAFRVRREEPWMEFVVQDNGIGMDRETREKLFSLFFSSKGISGTGLGLFISNKIVDKHGGTIDVESEPGRGARFTVRLPLTAQPSVRPTVPVAATETT